MADKAEIDKYFRIITERPWLSHFTTRSGIKKDPATANIICIVTQFTP
ncbi:hypothetical protein ACFLXA_05175 [Chloroflexota bacterium]